MEYFEVPRPDGDGYCSDDNCPCGFPGELIPRGTGYIYISPEVVDFRCDARTVREAAQKIARMEQQLGGVRIFAGSGVFAPILMCEQGARRRRLDMEVAAADAKYWWETGLVPLRPTPILALKSQQFEGRTVEEAKAAAANAIPAEKVREMEVTRHPQKKTIDGEGKDAEAAIQAAKAKVPAGAFDIGPAQITREGQRGTVEIQAYSEVEARRAWKSRVPAEASLEKMECLLAPSSGFLGLGKKPGSWRAHWYTPFRAQISLQLPAVVTVRFQE